MNSQKCPLYEKENIIPIVINYRGYIYGESRKLLDKFLPEIDHIELMAVAIK